MARKHTREELIKLKTDAQDDAMAWYLFAKQLTPAPGWYFVTSKHALSAWLISVDHDGDMVRYILHDKGRTAIHALMAALYRHESELPENEVTWPTKRFSSFLDASAQVSKWVAENFPQEYAPAR